MYTYGVTLLWDIVSDVSRGPKYQPLLVHCTRHIAFGTRIGAQEFLASAMEDQVA